MTGEGAPLVDCHAHAFHRQFPFVRDAWTIPDYDFTAESLIATLDAHGVECAVISGLSIAGTWNEYTLEALRAQDEAALNELLIAQLPASVEVAIQVAGDTIEERMNALAREVPRIDATLEGATRSTLSRMQDDLKKLHDMLDKHLVHARDLQKQIRSTDTAARPTTSPVQRRP